MGFDLKTKWTGVSAVLLGLLLVVAGCGSDAGQTEAAQQQQARRQAAQEAHREAERRRLRRIVIRERHEEERRLARQRAAREQAREEAREREVAEEREAEESEASECDPNYSGACLDPYASDYDCEGGSGDGPEYTGPVAVVGEDHYGLDADGDGYGCE